MKIHPSSIIEDGALIGENVEIGPYSIVRKNVTIGSSSFIGAFCDIGVGNKKQLSIGKNAIIRSHTVIYGGSLFLDSFETGHHVVVRENVIAGKNLRLGINSTLQNNITVGNYVRMHSNVHISSGTSIGNFVWIFPFTNTTNDPHPPSSFIQNVKINDYAVLSTNSLILPGVEIGEGCVIGASSKVSESTMKDHLYAGNPAKKICHTSKLRLKNDPSKSAYPWRENYQKGYPEETVKLWNQILE
jgi:acetyltransferase-like isoleucine patch superfamily enzyme